MGGSLAEVCGTFKVERGKISAAAINSKILSPFLCPEMPLDLLIYQLKSWHRTKENH